MRLIDADALMEILTTAIRNMKGMAEFLNAEDDPEIKMEIKAYTDILNGVKEQPTIEPDLKWILCSERLPEKTGYYICTCHDGTKYRTSVLKWSTGWTLTGARSYWKVIAWQPLPEPYKGER